MKEESQTKLKYDKFDADGTHEFCKEVKPMMNKFKNDG